MNLMHESPKNLTEVLQITRTTTSPDVYQNDLLMNQNDPIFLNHIFLTLGSDLSKIIEITGRPSTQENIFHILASGSHFLSSCQLLVDTLEDAVVVRLMLARSRLTMKSPLILALSTKTEVTAMGSHESEKVGKPHSQALVATLFWKTCEKAVLNNPSLMESMKVLKFFTYLQLIGSQFPVSTF